MTDQLHVGETGAAANPPQPGLKFLEFTVYFMGGLLILMVIGLIAGIAWKATRRAPPPEGPKVIELGLPQGAPTGPLTLDGDRLVIHSGNEIIVLDVRKGVILTRIKLSAP
jgi:hypothetical protein